MLIIDIQMHYLITFLYISFMFESNPRVPMPPPPPSRADPQAFDIFYFFGQIPHPAGPFFGQMQPYLGLF